MITAFSTIAGGITAQPSAAGERIIVRSTSAADTTQDITFSGNVAATPDSELRTLLGQREVQSTNLFQSLLGARLSASCAGAVSFRRPGVAGAGPIIVTTNPSDGNTLTVGLTGFTQAYVYRAKARTTLVCRPTSGLSQGDYFDISLSGTTRRFWYDIDAAGTSIPSDPGGGLSMISIATGNADTVVATTTEAVIEAVTNLTSSVTTATVTVDYDILGVMVVTDGPGDALGAVVVVAAGTADAAFQIALGATASATATNIRDAINDSVGVEGVGYGTGTTAHLHLTAAVSGIIITTTDRLPCARQLGWSFTQTGSGLSLSTPTGGVDGAVIGTITAGNIAATGAISMENEALTIPNIPPLATFVSRWEIVNARPVSIVLGCSNVVTPLTATYEIATDTAYPIPGVTTLAALDNNRFAVALVEGPVMHIRLTVANPNTTSANVNAKVVF